MQVRHLILLLGLPGCGKEKQGKLISEAFSNKGTMVLSYVCSELIAKAKLGEDELGRSLRSQSADQAGGKLLDNSDINNIVDQYLFAELITKDWGVALLDGFMRAPEQVEYFLERLAGLNEITKRRQGYVIELTVVNINVQDDVATARMMARPGRNDNGYQTIVERRLPEYREKTLPALRALERNEVKVIGIDGQTELDNQLVDRYLAGGWAADTEVSDLTHKEHVARSTEIVNERLLKALVVEAGLVIEKAVVSATAA